MNKKLLLAIIIITMIVIAGIIFVVIKNNKQTDFESQVKITTISQSKILFPILSQNSQKILFFSNTKESAFYEMDLDGKNVKMVSDPLDTPDKIVWSPDRKLAILKVIYDQYIFEKYGSKFSSPGTPDQIMTTWLYDFGSQKLSQLDNSVQEVIWTSDNKIIYQFLDQENNISRLNIANPDGTNWAKIVDLPSLIEYGFNLSDPKSLTVYSTPSDVSKSNIYTLSLENKDLKKIKEIEGSTKAIGLNNNWVIFTTPTENGNSKINFIKDDGSGSKKTNYETIILTLSSLDQNRYLIAVNDDIANSALYSFNTTNLDFSQLKDLSKDKITIQALIGCSPEKTIYFTSDDILYSLTLP